MKFLKFTKWKVIITLVLTAIFEGFVYWVGLHSVLCEVCDRTLNCPPCVSPETGVIMASITLVPALLIFYLISCFIIWLIKKVRK